MEEQLKDIMQKEIEVIQQKVEILVAQIRKEKKEKKDLLRLISRKKAAMDSFFNDKVKSPKKKKEDKPIKTD